MEDGISSLMVLAYLSVCDGDFSSFFFLSFFFWFFFLASFPASFFLSLSNNWLLQVARDALANKKVVKVTYQTRGLRNTKFLSYSANLVHWLKYLSKMPTGSFSIILQPLQRPP